MPKNYFMYEEMNVSLAKATADYRMEVETGQVEETKVVDDSDDNYEQQNHGEI